jgi:hypothetical protein
VFSLLLHAIFNLPVAESKPNIYNKRLTMNVMKIKGINTINQDTIFRP